MSKINTFVNDKSYEIIGNGLCHNTIYREKDITCDYLSGKVSNNIANGTFHDIFPGDRITFDRRTYVVGGLDCYMGKGDMPISSHHLLMFPLEPLGTAQMNPTNTSNGGFKGSELYKDLHSTDICSYYETISGDFGSKHLLEFRALLSNDTVSEKVDTAYGKRSIVKSSGWEWSTEFLTLMSEIQVWGITNGATPLMFDMGEARERIPVFKLTCNMSIFGSFYWWLRGVSSDLGFCYAGYRGDRKSHHYATCYLGVRPFFLIR